MRLHVVTWNILAPIYVKCEYYASTPCHRLQIRRRRPVIHRMLQWVDADVYLLQEVTHTEFETLQERLPHYHWFFRPHALHHWSDSAVAREPNGNVVALRKTLGVQRLRATAVSLSGGNRAIRVTGTLKTAAAATGIRLSLWSVHLEDASQTCRVQQMKRLQHRLGASRRNTVEIVGGDFNDVQGGITQALQTAGFRGSPSSVARTTYFEERPLSLDYLLVRSNPPLEPFWYIPPSSRTRIIAQFGSDHLPVMGVLPLLTT